MSKEAKPKGKFTFEVEGKTISTDDGMLEGRDIRENAGYDPASEYVLIEVKDRYTSSVGLEDEIRLEQGETRIFRIFEGDLIYPFTVDERGWEWGAATILEADVRRYGRIVENRDLVLEGPAETIIARDGTIRLDPKGAERLRSRKRPVDRIINITFVVNGTPETFAAKPDDLLHAVLAKALEKTENVGQPVENWEVRSEDGALFDQDLTLAALGIVDGTVFIANLRTGAAG